MYKCKYCGEEFEVKQKLAGHVGRCDKNPNYSRDRMLKQMAEARNNIDKSNKNFIGEKSSEEYGDIFICKYCDKICKNNNSLKNHERLCKYNPNRLESPLIIYNKTKHHTWNKGLSKETNGSIRKQGETLRKRYQSGELVGPNKGKITSDETKLKISRSRKEFLLKNPDKVPYILNHSSNISYPEHYFIELFKKENIDLKYHKQIGLYQLDFYNDDLKKYIEIDGEQHYLKASIIRDAIRTEKLKEMGWEGMRIRWSEYKRMDTEEKLKLIHSIKEFIK